VPFSGWLNANYRNVKGAKLFLTVLPIQGDYAFNKSESQKYKQHHVSTALSRLGSIGPNSVVINWLFIQTCNSGKF
jgi:hypothetical protein